MVFIIDELDRCRPDFALSVLERIKHFFSVQNVHFVLGANCSQLRNSIRSAYGNDVDAALYLQKFVSVTFLMGNNTGRLNRTAAIHYLRHISQSMTNIRSYMDMIEAYDRMQALNLRSIERIATAISLAVNVSPVMPPPQILSPLAVMKVMRPDLYAKAVTGHLRYEDMSHLFGFPASLVNPTPSSSDPAVWWAACLRNPPAMIDASRIEVEQAASEWGRRLADLVPYIASLSLDHVEP